MCLTTRHIATDHMVRGPQVENRCFSINWQQTLLLRTCVGLAYDYRLLIFESPYPDQSPAKLTLLSIETIRPKMISYFTGLHNFYYTF